MLRKIITINEDLCNGCGDCVTGCSEGAIAIIEGKAKLVKEEYCDGFGDCISNCPTGAIVIEERESEAFDENAAKKYLLETQGEAAVKKMEDAMKRHEQKINIPVMDSEKHPHSGCPGKQSMFIGKDSQEVNVDYVPSKLQNWPVQLHLLPLKAPYYKNANLLLAADCCAFAYGNFHSEFMTNRITAIGCPKLDDMQTYFEKITAIFANNDIDSVTVAYMEVPCCGGIVKLAEESVKQSRKNIPIKKIRIGIKGNIL